MFKAIVKKVNLANVFAITFFLTMFAALMLQPVHAWATSASAETVSSISVHVNDALGGLAGILESVSLICGIGFILVSFFKFHQHKLNPTQVPISQAITLLVIGACLTVFPHLIKTPTSAITGNSTIASLGGGQIKTIIGTTGGSK